MGRLEGISTSKAPIQLTIKFRLIDADWQWIKDQFGYADGEIVFRPLSEIPSNLQERISNADPNLQIPESPVEDGAVKVWQISFPVTAASDHSYFSSTRLGIPQGYTRLFGIVRHSRAWLCPRQGRPPLSLTEDSLLVSFLLNDGFHLVLLALSSVELLTLFRSDEGNVVAISRNDAQIEGKVTVLASVAGGFEDAIAALLSYARQIYNEQANGLNENLKPAYDKATRKVESQHLERWYDSLGYCTWNGIGQDLNEQKLLSALNTLSYYNIKLSSLTIDDNWQSLDFEGDSHFDYRWTNFEADQKGFPLGLKHAIKFIRETHPYIENIAVWHGLFGYWNAIAPDGEVANQYKTRRARKQESGFLGGGAITVVDADDIHRMYDDFYR